MILISRSGGFFRYTSTVVRSYLFGISITALLTLIALGLVLVYFDPTSVGSTGVVLLFLSLTITLASWLTLLGYVVRVRLAQATEVAFKIALRQGITAGCLVAGLILLKTLDFLNWRNAVMLVVAVLLLELRFKTKVE